MLVKQVDRDHNWNQKFKVLCEEIQKIKDGDLILSSFKSKYGYLGKTKIVSNNAT